MPPITRSGPHTTVAPVTVAHLIFRLDTGGLENGLVNLINRMPERYRHVVICLTDYTEFRNRITRANVEVHALHKRPGKDIAVYWRLWRLLRRIRPDILHTRNIGTLDGQVCGLLAGVGVRVHGEHGWDVTDLHGDARRYRWLRRISRHWVAAFVAVSRHIRDWLVTTIGVAEPRVVHICNGVDTDRFRPRDIPRSSAECVFGTVGRLDPVKDTQTLVTAFALLLAERPAARQRLRLVLIGDGALRDDLQAQVERAGVSDRVWLAGDRSDIPQQLRDLDVFVLPSLNEGISNTVLEAMASGLPVIASDVGGNPELVQSARTGMLVPVQDPEALCAAMTAYLDNSGLRSEHGANGRRLALQQFSLNAMVSAYTQLYDELRAGRVPTSRIAEEQGR